MDNYPERSDRPGPVYFAREVAGPLSAFGRSLRVFSVLYGLSASLAVLAGTSLLWVILYLINSGPPVLFAVLFWGAVLGMALIPLVIHAFPLILFPPGLNRLAGMVEAGFPALGGRLRAAVELESGIEPGVSAALRDLNLKQVGDILRDCDLKRLLAYRSRDRWLRFTTLALAGILAVVLAAPMRFGAAAKNGLDFFRGIEPGPAVRLVLFPGETTILRASDVDIMSAVVPSGAAVPSLFFGHPGTDGRWVTMEPLADTTESDASDLYHYPLRKVLRPIEYYAVAGDAVSDTFHIRLMDRPSVIGLQVTLKYPAYTRVPPRRLDDRAGDIVAPVGTGVEIELESDYPLQSAEIVFDDSSRVPLRVKGPAAAGSWRLDRQDSYRIEITGENGVSNYNPARYRVVPVMDEPPFIQIVSPEIGFQPGEKMVVPVSVTASDDWGIESVWLEYSQPDRQTTGRIIYRLEGDPRREVSWRTDWDLSPLDLRPGDILEYRLAAGDNDDVNGPKVTYTDTRTIRLPTISELFDLAEREVSREVPLLSDIFNETARIRELLKDVNRDLSIREELDWSRKEDLKSALSRQGELTRETLESLEKLDETMARMEESGRMTLEIAEKMDNLRRLMAEVLPPDVYKRLQELSRKVDEMAAKELSKELSDLRKEQENFLQRLDRTLALIKELKRAQEIEALEKFLDELIARQGEVLDSTLTGRTADDLRRLSPEEEKLAADLGELGERTGALADSLGDADSDAAEELDRIGKEMSDGRTGADMKAAGEHLQRGERDQAVQREESAAEGLESLAGELAQATAGLKRKASEEIREEVDRTTTDLLGLSFEQETINRKDGETGAAERQAAVGDGIQSARRQLEEVGRKSFHLDPTVNQKLDRAVEESRAASEAHSQGQDEQGRARGRAALSSLNQALEALFRVQEAMAQSASAMGFEEALKQLEAMAGAQGKINLRTGELSGDLGDGPDGISLEEREMLRRLARDQALLRDKMKEIGDLMQERERLLGDLDEIAGEMDEVVRDLENHDVSEETIESQKRILSRMLDASRSMHRRDYSPRRLSTTARPYLRLERPTGEVTGDSGSESVWLDMARALEEDFPPEYEPLIRAYFRSLARMMEGKEEGK